MTAHKHKYAKLNDEAVFCEGCGDIRTVQRFAPVPYPYWWQPVRYYPWWDGTVTTVGDVTIGSTVYDDGTSDNVTYTLTNGTGES